MKQSNDLLLVGVRCALASTDLPAATGWGWTKLQKINHLHINVRR